MGRPRLTRISIAPIILVLMMLSVSTPVDAVSWSVNYSQLTSNPYYDGFPAFAQTKDGRVWFVWSQYVEGNLTLYYMISCDQGRTWSEEMNLTNPLGSGENQNPSIMQAKNGTIWVVWTSDRPAPPPPPTPDFYMDAQPESITVPQGGFGETTIAVTSINNFSNTVSLDVLNKPTGVVTTLDPTHVVPPVNGTANSTLTISVDVTATPGNYTLLVTGRSGKLMHSSNVYLEITAAGGAGQTGATTPALFMSPSSASASIEDYEIYCKTSHDNGATWTEDIQLTDNQVDDLRPAIIQLTNGTLMIVWQTYISGSFNIVYQTTTDGINWSDPQQLTTNPTNDKAPSAIQTKDGKIWVTWASDRNVDYEIYYKIYDGATWSTDQRLTTDTNSDVQPAIVQAIDGNVMIFWASGSATADYDINYKYSSNNGATWSGTIPFVTTGYEDFWPAVMRAQDTKIWVAWHNNEADQPDGNWDIYFRTSLAGDVNEDGQTNVIDLTIVSLAYGTMIGNPNYNPVADINKDGIVEMQDLRTVAYYLGAT